MSAPPPPTARPTSKLCWSCSFVIATACYGSDESQFPPNNLFAAAGDAIWDNGASCGRRYLVRCLSSATPGACMDSSTVEVTVVDYAPSLVSAPSAVGATMVLSETAFGMISQSSANEINIEFTQV
ncbi:Rare lipoprotein A (RlpA)-like double-psi beta-barrel [Musa troglodytarum]|uniref:Rare lipoprotein A (RlpA)-like double-psi beta-barrel n=1 Tax=Musa troglodytarum TaxID=320322 RepID=A0A9E7JQ09_9LILI|nr:Rare lipoprotein A (RlpA)-like double-psi beta-barrel [Musa troglodytarum]